MRKIADKPEPGTKLEGALRALARSSAGPFRAIGYAAPGEGEDRREAERELRRLIRKERLAGHEPILVVERGDDSLPPAERPGLRGEVLPHLIYKGKRKKGGGGGGALTGRAAPARARRALSEAASEIPSALEEIDRKLSRYEKGIPALEEHAAWETGDTAEEDPLASVPKEEMKEKDESFSWILVVRRFEDLGRSAAQVAGAASRVIENRAHILVAEEGIDTRRREGRALLRTVIRLGRLGTKRASERALAEVERRRKDLKVFGRVPFGFRREGKKLVPVEEELEVVAKLKELSGREGGPTFVAAELNRKGLLRRGKPWSRLQVIRTLENPIYDHVLGEGKA